MAEDNAKTLLSPYASGNGYDTWKRMMRIRLHQSKFQKAQQYSSDPKLHTDLTKSQEKLINQNSNKLLIAKSSVTLRGGNGSWTLGSTASSPKRHLQVQQFGRAAHPARTPVPVPPAHPAFPTLGSPQHPRTRTTPQGMLSNTRGLVLLSDNIHARTRKRIQRYTTAKKRHVTAASVVAAQQQYDPEGDVDELDPYASCHMLLLPQSRLAARARCQEEVDKFGRIMRWIEDCKEAMADGEFDVDLPSITD
jgi:hypothetical protein